MKTTLIASLISCHLLWGVACADGERHQTEHHVPTEEDHPGIVLFNLNKPLDDARTTDSRPAYYGVRDEPNRYPNNVMFEAIASLPANNRLWTISPDAFPEAENPLRSWRDFNVLDWNGTDPLPRMRPDSCVRRIQSLQRSGILPRDLNGYSFLIDWENGATAVREMGLTYWSDPSSPRFRAAWIEYRDQVVETLEALKARFPSSFFAVYAGGSIARVIGQNEAGTAPVMADGRDARARRYYLHDTPKPVLETIRRHYAEAMGPLLHAPHFHTVVCYDAYGPLDWDELDGFPPEKNETYLVECFRLLKKHSTKPVYGIVGAFTSGNRNLEHDGRSNQDYQMVWKDRASWLKRTCRWLSRSDADGALIWNGLDALIFRYLSLNVRNYDEINAEIRRYLDPAQIGGWNQWISLDRQSGTLFKELAELHGQPDTRNYQTPQRYYDNISRSQRQSDATLDIFLKTISRTWRDQLLPDLLSTLRTGLVPLHVEKEPVVESDRDDEVVGSNLYVVERISGDLDSITYQWMRNGEPIGPPSKNPVHRLTRSDVGKEISCEITYLARDGSEPIVRVARIGGIITTPNLATIEIDEDGSTARGIPEEAMASALGVDGLEPFTITLHDPIALRASEGTFPQDAARTRAWTIENGRNSITITIDASSMRLEGDTLIIDDERFRKMLLSGRRNVITGISPETSD
ncbi:MAG: hypothetical protein CMJ33_08280 [Phycisphaerae bacterium]|nr:hypothetical protein [Phycisphaerae bacterium]